MWIGRTVSSVLMRSVRFSEFFVFSFEGNQRIYFRKKNCILPAPYHRVRVSYSAATTIADREPPYPIPIGSLCYRSIPEDQPFLAPCIHHGGCRREFGDGSHGLRESSRCWGLLGDLRIGDDDFDDLVIDEDISAEEEHNLLAVARVLTDKSFSAAAFEDTMNFAWSLAQKVQFRDIWNHMFILQFSCLGDWTKVVEEGPWLFRNWGIVTALMMDFLSHPI
jgi:hypothetical protein